MVFWKQLGAEREEEEAGPGHKTAAQDEMELGTQGVPEVDSRRVQKARHSLLSKVGLSAIAKEYGWCSRQGSLPREITLLVGVKSQSENNLVESRRPVLETELTGS